MNARFPRLVAWLFALAALVLAGHSPTFGQGDAKAGDDDAEMAGKDKAAGADANPDAGKRDDPPAGKDKTGPGGEGEKADKTSRSTVYLFKSQKKAKAAGAEVTSLIVQDAFTGKRVSLTVPDAAVAAAVEGLDEGVAIEVGTERHKGKWVVTSLAKADIQPGEEQPNAFVYVAYAENKDRGGNKTVVVTLRKFGREIKVGVPMWRNDDYQEAVWEPDEKIDAQLRQLASGEVVAALIKTGRPPMLAEIYPYEPPERGKFVKVKDTTHNGAAAAAFELVAADGTTVTITLPGTERKQGEQKVLVPDMKTLRAVQKLKADTEIEVLFREEGQTLFLIDYKLLSAKESKGGKPAKGKADEGKTKGVGDDGSAGAENAGRGGDASKDGGKSK